MSERRHDPVSADEVEQIGRMLIPHFRDAMRDDLNAIHAKLDLKADSAEVQQLRSDVTSLKAHSGIWGAFGGVLTSLVTALPSMLGKSKTGHAISLLLGFFRGH